MQWRTCGGVADACKDVSARDYESFEARKVVSPNKNTEQKWRPHKIKHTLISLDDRLFILLNGLLARQKMGNPLSWQRTHSRWIGYQLTNFVTVEVQISCANEWGFTVEVQRCRGVYRFSFHSNRGAFIVVVVLVLVEKWSINRSIDRSIWGFPVKAGWLASQPSFPPKLELLTETEVRSRWWRRDQGVFNRILTV